MMPEDWLAVTLTIGVSVGAPSPAATAPFAAGLRGEEWHFCSEACYVKRLTALPDSLLQEARERGTE